MARVPPSKLWFTRTASRKPFRAETGVEEAAVVVRTSGSTGTPKATVLTMDALAASSVATAMALRGEGQWLLALPLQYVAGVQVLVRSLLRRDPALGDGPVGRLHA